MRKISMDQQLKILKKKNVSDGWLVLVKSPYYDWTISFVYTKDEGPKPKLKCKKWVSDLDKRFPGLFSFKIRPCKVVY